MCDHNDVIIVYNEADGRFYRCNECGALLAEDERRELYVIYQPDDDIPF